MASELSQSAQAYLRLEEEIVTLRLKPGEPITEAALTKRTGLGRTPIREAIQRLSWEGLLSIRPRLGIIVAEMNPSDFLKVLEARHGLERLVAGLAARLAGKGERRTLEACAEDLREAAARSDVEDYLRHDKAFDDVVSVAACNPFASKALAPLQTQSRRFWYRHLGEEDLNPAARSHLEVMRAVSAGDERAASEHADNLMLYLRRQATTLVSGHR